jgi:acetyltransferase-like isoleucine patch superfamily enzyme
VPPPAWAFAACGPNTTIVPPARIENPGSIKLGDFVLIHEHAWLLARPQSGDDEPTLVLGDRILLQRFVKIVSVGSVIIGDGANIGDHVYISDVEYEPGHATVRPQHRPLTVPRPVVIEHHALLGVGTIVKPGVTIGSYAYIGAGSVVTADVPPRSLAVGAPARVINQY